MSGNSAGGKAAAQTNKQRYSEDFYKNMGKVGGKAKVPKGFSMSHERAVAAGRVGGSKSRRGPNKPKPIKKHWWSRHANH